MRLNDIMSRDIKTIGPKASASEARNAMRTNGIRHLLVLDGRDVVGVVSDLDSAAAPPPTATAAPA